MTAKLEGRRSKVEEDLIPRAIMQQSIDRNVWQQRESGRPYTETRWLLANAFLYRIAAMVCSRLAKVVLATASFSLSSLPAAQADSLTDYFGPREVALGEGLRADARGSLASTLNPSGLALTRQLVFEGGYAYRGEDNASLVTASACDSTVPLPGCFYYHFLTAKLEVGGTEFSRRVHEFGVSAARAISPRFSIGVNMRYFDFNSELIGEGDASGFAGDAGATVRATDSVQIGVVGYNLVAADSAQYPMGIGAGLALRPSPQFAIGFDGLWNLDVPDGSSTGRYGGGAEYVFEAGGGQGGYPLRLGGVHDRQLDASYITGGLGLLTAKIGIDVGGRREIGGGDAWMVVASLRLFGPRLP